MVIEWKTSKISNIENHSEKHFEEYFENYDTDNEILSVQNITTSLLKKRTSKIYQYFTYGTNE
ncbi:5273_t:CDS:2, partial [Diversispora eburnea]